MSTDSDSEGHCALVTGGGRGIGAAISRRLAADGWPVALAYRAQAAAAAAVVASIEESGGRAVAIQADVGERGSADRLVEEAAAALGQPAVLVNNAGVREDELLASLTDEQWDSVLETNLSGAARCMRAAMMGMVRSRWGRIVNVASIVGVKGNAGQTNYAASKAGLIGLTKSAALEVARRGVTVNAVAPGYIETAMTAELPKEATIHIPARRAGTPEDVAGCVSFIASEDASYVTGAVLTVDGGLTA